jgi:hypothetical protein
MMDNAHHCYSERLTRDGDHIISAHNSFFLCFIHSFFVVGLVGCLCNLLSGTTLVEDPNGVIILQQNFVHSPTKKFEKIWKKCVFFLMFKISLIFPILENEICQIIDIKIF